MNDESYEPVTPINAFGEELRAHRNKAGWRLDDLAPKLVMSPAMLGAVERGTRAPRYDTAAKCDELFGMPGTFDRLWRIAAKRAMPAQVSPYYDLEAQAARIHKWELRCIPGLLQTADYARGIMRTGWPRETDELIEDDVQSRMDRQQILAKDNPPLAWFIIDESVLYRGYGDMRAQLRKLAQLAEFPHIVIQVMPFTATDHPGLRGPLTILEFASSPMIGYAEGWGSGRLIESHDDVAASMACYDLIRAAALPQSASLEMIKRIGELNELG